MPLKDKEANAAYMRAYHSRPEARAAARKRKQKRRQDWLNFIYADKMKCQVCGYDKCFAALDQHHNAPAQKDFTVGQFIGSRACSEKNKKILLKELGKCICMCSNCHKEFHDLQRKLQEESNAI